MLHSHRVLSRLLLFCACLIVAFGCGPKNAYVEPPPPPVRIAQPLQETVTNYLEATGTTEAVQYVEIRARIKGFLKKIHFKPGQDVQAGDLLYEIEPDLYQAQLDQAKAARGIAEADRANAQAQYDIAAPLFEKGSVPRTEFEARKAAVQVAEAQIKAAEAAIREAELNLQYTRVTSPISGRVGKTLVHEGNLVGDGQATHLTTVVKYDPIYANFSINERDFLRITDRIQQQGDDIQPEDVQLFLRRDIDADFIFAGHLDFADLELDPSTGTYSVRGIFSNPDMRIIPGAFVRIRVKGKATENSLLIPEHAIDLGTSSVLIVRGETVERRTVKTGLKLKELVVIEQGLEPDDWVIVEGIQRARPGLKVAPKKVELPPFQGDGVAVRETNYVAPPATGPRLQDIDAKPGSESLPPAAEPQASGHPPGDASLNGSDVALSPVDTDGDQTAEQPADAGETSTEPDGTLRAGQPPQFRRGNQDAPSERDTDPESATAEPTEAGVAPGRTETPQSAEAVPSDTGVPPSQ